MPIFDITMAASVIILMIPVSILLLQILAAILGGTSGMSAKKHAPPVAVLMPAHNEALVITAPVQAILAQLKQPDQLVVVADNCSDETASIARNLGATVIERSDLQQRGKGYALDFGLKYFRSNPPEVLLIVDADCIVAENAIQSLAAACVEYQRPVQALYLMGSQTNPSLKQRVAEFAWVVKNKVRPLGFMTLGLPCQMMGTGMAFLWSDICKINLASGHIVEDMKLGIDLARINKAPLFMPEALVTSTFPPTQEATNTQRTRWEHGHLSVILSEAPRLYYEAIKLKNLQILGLACDLIVPPLAVLSLLCSVLFVLSMLFASPYVFMLAAGLLLGLILAVLLAWLYYGRQIISFKQLCYAPVYALMKIPLYVKFLFNRQLDWVRSKRD